LDAVVADWIIKMTATDVLDIFNRHDVVVGRIYDIEDIFKDPQYAARGAIVPVEDDDFGTLRMPGGCTAIRSELRDPPTVRWRAGRGQRICLLRNPRAYRRRDRVSRP
jgi:crotonobetainyl-CoA:carnitine CoA-transferase CaiB-like acyl-CoA transferase